MLCQRKDHEVSTIQKNYRTLRNGESWRNSLPPGKSTLVGYSISDSQSIYIQVTLYRIIRIYIYENNNEKEIINYKFEIEQKLKMLRRRRG